MKLSKKEPAVIRQLQATIAKFDAIFADLERRGINVDDALFGPQPRTLNKSESTDKGLQTSVCKLGDDK